VIVVAIIGFFAALLVSMVLSSVAGALAARLTRHPAGWVPLSLFLNVPFQVALVSAVNLARCAWQVEDGEAPFAERYAELVAKEWSFGVTFGAVMAVVGWVWSLKRIAHFLRPEPEPQSPPLSASMNDGLREALEAVIARARAEQAAKQARQSHPPEDRP